MRALRIAAERIHDASALVVTAGAGMGVDSGLPDFRGNEGFWRAYPMYRKRRLDFASMANPRWFENDCEMAWGFYAHRRNMYLSTTPHRGFEILRRAAQNLKHGGFVFTSNVDGHFQKAGFSSDRVYECHGSIQHLQCAKPCRDRIWTYHHHHHHHHYHHHDEGGDHDQHIPVDTVTMRVESKNIPRCHTCQHVARPNILMFGDWGFIPDRTLKQQKRMDDWLDAAKNDGGRIVIVEVGAGTSVPTVRNTSERLAQVWGEGACLIRINAREEMIPNASQIDQAISIKGGALSTLEALEAELNGI
mmetsp:Transcript_39193/g.75291  ORF Transcript_39193/g.75291 Transcript_39193/m.75291 type:complete len:304 (-) Transcript_39193:221-1132(-)